MVQACNVSRVAARRNLSKEKRFLNLQRSWTAELLASFFCGRAVQVAMACRAMVKAVRRCVFVVARATATDDLRAVELQHGPYLAKVVLP